MAEPQPETVPVAEGLPEPVRDPEIQPDTEAQLDTEAQPDTLMVGVKVAEAVAVRQAETVAVTVALPPKFSEKAEPPLPAHHEGKSAMFIDADAACGSTMRLLDSHGNSCKPQGPLSVQI